MTLVADGGAFTGVPRSAKRQRPCPAHGVYGYRAQLYAGGRYVGNLRVASELEMEKAIRRWLSGSLTLPKPIKNFGRNFSEIAPRPRRIAAVTNGGRTRRTSTAVRAQVILRSKGRSEFSGQPAPFFSKNGNPGLEVHHPWPEIDGTGYAIALTPNEHAETKFGEFAYEMNEECKAILREIEPCGQPE